MQRAVNGMVVSEREDWKGTAGSPPATDEPASGFSARLSTPVDVDGLAVVSLEIVRYAAGAAHPLTLLRSVSVDTRTGRPFTKAGMLAEMQRTGGPQWDFERELRRYARLARPQEPQVAPSRADVGMYPTRAGMAITVDHCALFSCASGAVEFTIPWSQLVGPKDRMSFIPDHWGH